MRINKLSLVAGVALGALMVCGTLANAQDTKDSGGKEGKKGKGPQMTVEQILEKMTKDLSLTDEQKPKVKAVLEDTQKKRQELRSSGGGGGDRAAMREKMQEIGDAQDKKFKEILKADQYEKWEKVRDEMRKKGKGGPGGDKQGGGQTSTDKKD